MARQHFADAAIESLDRAIGLRVTHRREAVLDPVFIAQTVQSMLAGWLAGLGVQPIGESLVLVDEQLTDSEKSPGADRLEERRRCLGILTRLHLDIDPAHGPVDGHEQIPEL